MNKITIELFKEYFKELDLKDLESLNQIYADEIVFKDPIHEIRGIEGLKQYFAKLNKNLKSGSFTFTDEAINQDKVYLSWEMKLSLKRPKKKIEVSGVSVLTIKDKITRHEDYFDAGQLFYEHVPLLGSIIKFLKKKI